MFRERAAFLKVVVPIVAALTLILFACSSDLTYAKGVNRSQDTRDNASSGKSSSDSQGSSNKSSSDSQSNSNRSSGGSQGNSSGSNQGSSNSSSRGNSSYGSSQSSQSRSDNSSSYRKSNESGSSNSSTYRNSNSNESKNSNPPTYRKEDDSRHKAPPTQSRSNDSTVYRKEASNETKQNDNPFIYSKGNDNSKSNSSTVRSNSSTTSPPQDDPRHKAPGVITREKSNDSQLKSGAGSPPTNTMTKQNSPVVGGLKGHVTRSESTVRVQDRSHVRDSVSSPAGAFRKDYENLADIWRSRRESAIRSGERDHHDGGTRVNININFFPGHYNYYAYDYRPGYAYPSLYCYYYGLFPPYIYHHRVHYVRRVFPAVVYVEIPVYIFRDDYVYYDSYYSREWKYRSLQSSLRDIERAWERQDVDLLIDHVRRNDQVDISLRGEYAYSVDRQDFYEMTLDAMENIRTASFEFYNVRWDDSRYAIAYAKHVYYDDQDGGDGDRRIVYLKYRMEKSDNQWYIMEVGSSPDELY